MIPPATLAQIKLWADAVDQNCESLLDPNIKVAREMLAYVETNTPIVIPIDAATYQGGFIKDRADRLHEWLDLTGYGNDE